MLIFPLTVALLLSSAPREIFLDASGDDLNPGTADKPVATLTVAKERARAAQCHTITVRGGNYVLWKPVTLNPRDNGLTIRAAKGARPRFLGGVIIPPEIVRPCTNQAILRRIIQPEARTLIKRVSLVPTNTMFAPIKARGFPQPPRAAPSELFANDVPLTLARWPNSGYANVGVVTEPGNGEQDRDKPARKPIFAATDPRPKLWASAKDVWAYGYWKYDWADESIPVESIDAATGQMTLARPHTYGVATGSRFFAENLLEELDQPGEYWIDRDDRSVYFIPPADSKPQRYELSLLDEPMIAVADAAKITVRGLDLSVSRGDGIAIDNCEDVRIEGCRLFNLGGRGAVIQGGHRCGLQSCDVWNTGEGGVTMSGGDRLTLKPGLNFVDNCDIHHYQRRSQTYRPAVLLSGVGNRVSHCAMHDAPHSAIIFGGNDHIIELNEFYRTISATGDGGVVYTGRDWTARGTEIRKNYFHDNIGLHQWEPAIYVDDLGSGIIARDNLIVRCHWGFLIGGGHDNILEGNTLVDCKLAFDCDARGLGWGKSMLPTLTERLASMPYQSGPWSKRYPSLVDILAHDPLAPSGNVLRNNLLVRSGTVLQQMEAPFKQTATIEGNVETATAPKGNRTTPDKSIGIHMDALRASFAH